MASWVRIENFLNPAARQQILDYALTAPTVPAHVKPPGANEEGVEDLTSRSAMVGFDLEAIWPLLADHVAGLQGFAAVSLDLPPFVTAHVERQLTLHHDGGFFTVHQDIGSSDELSSSRVVAFVYYLRVGAWSGGELRLWDQVPPEGGWTDLPPVDNSLVLFPADCWHEVRQVVGDGCRVSINGWYHRVVA